MQLVLEAIPLVDLTLSDWDMIVLAGAAAILAGFVRGLTGFGGPAILLLILTQFYTPVSVVTKIMLIDFATNLFLVPSVRREIAWPTAGLVIAGSVVAFPLGIYALLSFDPVVMKRIIAIIVGTSVLAMMAGWRYRSRPDSISLLAVGVVTGAIAGATYIALTLVAFLFAGPDTPTTNRANVIAWGAIIGLMIVIGYVVTGAITASDVWRAGVIGGFYAGAAVVGARTFRSMAESLFRRIVLWLLLLLSVAGVLT